VFVKERMRFVAQLPNIELRIVSPLPYFPPWRRFKRWYPLSQIARREDVDGLPVVRPRYILPPKIGGYIHPGLMYPFVKRTATKLRREFDFDLIDAHFVYPDGVVATMLGRLYDKPVVITGRGEEIERFPRLPLIGKQIRAAVAQATQLVALSNPIRQALIDQGADPSKITVIPNGVDCERFHPSDQAAARRQLGLPADRPIVLAVGYLLEMKGFHLLVEAIAHIRAHFPDVLAVIVGGKARWGLDYEHEIRRQVSALGLEANVRLTGAQPPEDLPHWYSAADVLAILSSREGSPNVLMEALACGLPAVATPVGGIPEILSNPALGTLLPERSASAAAAGITAALSRTWHRAQIRDWVVQHRSWTETARQVERVFDRALAPFETSTSIAEQAP
jgi:glycosyltransferase involved in cell wall biosynthesis